MEAARRLLVMFESSTVLHLSHLMSQIAAISNPCSFTNIRQSESLAIIIHTDPVVVF